MIITSILIFPSLQKETSPAEIELRAGKMGMVYPEEIRALPKTPPEEEKEDKDDKQKKEDKQDKGEKDND